MRCLLHAPLPAAQLPCPTAARPQPPSAPSLTVQHALQLRPNALSADLLHQRRPHLREGARERRMFLGIKVCRQVHAACGSTGVL